MKNWKQITFLGIILLAFTACFIPSAGDEATLNINFGSNNGNSRLNAPPQWPPYGAGNTFTYNMKFIITLENKSKKITEVQSLNSGESISNAEFSFTVSTGHWKIDIKSYLEGDFLYATFSDNIYINPGENTIVAKMKKAYSETDDYCNHQWGNWTIATPATCTTTGVEIRVCALDSNHTETRTIPIDTTAHDWQWILTGDTEETQTCTRCSATNGTRPKSYSIGDTGPGGGKIFYVSETGFTLYMNETDTTGTTAHYLEAAPNDISGTLAWASSGYTYTDIAGTEEAIGTGRKNTALILKTDADAPAAKACFTYSNNGRTDWFLPSKDEINALYTNRNIVGNMALNWYWSSSQYSYFITWDINFSNGSWDIRYKENAELPVRAIRAFQ